MRGLVAIIGHDRTMPVEEREIGDLAASFESLRGRSNRYSARAGVFARVVRLNTTTESGIETDGGSWAATYGLVHYKDSLIGRPVESLDGQFALVSFDAVSQEVVVASDPLGLQALYVAERDGKTFVSTSALALAKHLRAKPNRFGMEVFLRAGYHFGSLTNWEGIERLLPGTLVFFTPHSRQRRTYWRPQIDERVNRLRPNQAADHLIDVATETFRSYLDNQYCYCTNLTGGYDSRLLNLLLRRAGISFRTNTRGDDRHPDVRFASRIVRETGWEWLHIALPHEWPRMQPEIVHAAAAWGDCHLDALDLSAAMWQPPELGIEPIMFNGGGAELMRNFAWQQEFLKVGKSNRVDLDNWIDMRLLHPMDTSVLARDSTAAVREDFGRRMVEWTLAYEDDLNTTQLDMMYAYKCTGHFGLYGPAFGAYGLIQSPFFFKPVFNVVTSIHWRHRNGHGLMRAMIERLDRRVAAIKTTSGGPAQPMRLSNMHRFVPYYSDIGARAINKLSEKAFGRSVISKSIAPTQHVLAARQACLSPLRNGKGVNGQDSYGHLRSAPLYHPNRLAELLRCAEKRDFQSADLVGRILTIELALCAVDGSIDG